MRQRYNTQGIVLARVPLAEASASVYLLTGEFGLVKARAQGVRISGAKLSGALQTLTECDTILVRGKETWRLSGALTTCNWFSVLTTLHRARAGRVARFLLRMVHGESTDTELFVIFKAFLETLAKVNEREADAAEHLVVLRLLRELGHDAGDTFGEDTNYTTHTLESILKNKQHYSTRINRGIVASGL